VGCSLQGVLAQAKNGDKLYWEEKFHEINGKVQTCIQGALLFFLLSLVEGGGGGGGWGVGEGRFCLLNYIWCGEWILHCSLSTSTMDFPCKFLGGGGLCQKVST